MNKNQFKKLQAKWYKKLKQSGFEDAENSRHELKDWALKFADDRRTGNASAINRSAKEKYYQLANQFLTDHTFDTPRERAIWEYHSNGMSVRNIVKTLKKVRIKTYKNAVWRVIDRLRKLMKQKYMVIK